MIYGRVNDMETTIDKAGRIVIPLVFE